MLPAVNLNLDRLAAQHAQTIINDTRSIDASKVDNTVTKALGILQENGFYACFLFLFAKDPDGASTVIKELVSLLQALNFGWEEPNPINESTVLAYATNDVTVDLERMLLAKETAEQMLIYARYGAKAR